MKKNKLFQLIFCLFLWGCSTSNYKQHEDLSSPLKNLIYKCVRDSSNTFSIDKNIGFEWKKLYIFMPYTSTNEIYQKLGYEWKEADNIKIKHSDSFNLLVFVDDKNQVIKHCELPRSYGDFATVKKKTYQNGEAFFQVKMKKGGGNKGDDWYYIFDI